MERVTCLWGCRYSDETSTLYTLVIYGASIFDSLTVKNKKSFFFLSLEYSSRGLGTVKNLSSTVFPCAA